MARGRTVWLAVVGVLVLVAAGVVTVIVAKGTREPASGVDEFPPLTVEHLEGTEIREGFERGEPGREPPGWVPRMIGPGSKGTWVLRNDAPGGMVAAQTSTDATSDRYPQLVYAVGASPDVEVSVRFKTVSGQIDQTGGLVLRHNNDDSFYAVRASSLENTIGIYRVNDGKQKQLARADLTVEPQTWHTLRVVAKDDRIDVYFNADRIMAVSDKGLPIGGPVGLLTKADSVTHFDDLHSWSLK